MPAIYLIAYTFERMEAHCINYAETGFFSKTITGYLDNNPELKAFYNYRPDMDGFRQLIQIKKPIVGRDILADVLQEQYWKISDLEYPVSDLTIANIDLLRLENTYTITTGHQLNIFTGPFYFIFKIATAIKLCRQLKAEFPEKNFVPVYWMASEDHDFAEINHTSLGGKKIQWDLAATGATGRLAVKTIRQALNQYKGVLGISANANELAAIVETAYTKFTNLADATRYLVNALFADFGLVIIDADDARLKKLFMSVMEQDIIGQNSYHNILASNAALQKLGVHIQVNPREINFFYLADNLRERIVFENGMYEVLNTNIRFNEEQLRQEIKEHPNRFSPNVAMRPLYQEVILPNLAYVGGGGELAYWLELKANFDYYKVDFPILILRNSALLIDEKTADKIKRMGLSTADVFKPAEELKTQWVKQNTENDLTLQQEWVQLEGIFKRLGQRSTRIDPTLGPSAEAIQARLKHAIGNLERKMLRAEKRNHTTRLNQVDTIKTALFPGGGLQERNENFGLFYVKYGEGLIAELIDKFEPLDFKFTVLTE